VVRREVEEAAECLEQHLRVVARTRTTLDVDVGEVAPHGLFAHAEFRSHTARGQPLLVVRLQKLTDEAVIA